MKHKIPYLFFVLAGSVINFIFYLKFFENTNYDWKVYWAMSIIFTGITAYLYFEGFRHNKKKVVWCAVIISLFSIICSTAGQFADTQKKLNTQVVNIKIAKNAKAKIDTAKAEIKRINRLLDSLELQLNETIHSAEDRYNWKNTTAGIEARWDKLTANKKPYEAIVSKKDPVDNTAEYASDIFDQMTDNIKIKIVIMLIFEILISIIIELTAPAALYLMTLQKNPVRTEHEKQQPAAKKKTMRDYIIAYADARFDGRESIALNGRPGVLQKTGMPFAVFNRITVIAVKKKLIQIRGKITEAAPCTTKEMFLDVMLKGEN